MRLKEFNILLDIKRTKKIEDIEVVHNDYETNVFNIAIVEDFRPYDLSELHVEIAFAKPDSTTVVQDNTNGLEFINATEGKVRCTLQTNTIIASGWVHAEVRIMQEEKILTTARFKFFVRRAIVDDETVKSTNEFPILNKLITDVGEITESVPVIEGKLDEITNTESGLNQSIQEGNTLKSGLNTSIQEGTILKINLDNSIAEGNDLKDELQDIIAGTDFEQVITELDNKVDKEIVGELDNLSTTDKSDIVAAINEVNTKIDEIEIIDMDAENVSYDNTTSELEAENVQDVIDEVYADLMSHKAENMQQYEELKYSELSSIATNIDSEGIYKNIEWKRKDGTTHAKSTLLGNYPYSQIKMDYYNESGTVIIKSITWDLTYDDNDFPYLRTVI